MNQINPTHTAATNIVNAVGEKLLLEYEPGMYRAITVRQIWEQYNRVRGDSATLARVAGMSAVFYADTGEEATYRYFSRKLLPFDKTLIESTRTELQRRRLVSRISEINWNAVPVTVLEEVLAHLEKGGSYRE